MVVCCHCEQPLGESGVLLLGQVYHAACAVCATCGRALVSETRIYRRATAPCCARCVEGVFTRRSVVSSDTTPSDARWSTESIAQPYAVGFLPAAAPPLPPPLIGSPPGHSPQALGDGHALSYVTALFSDDAAVAHVLDYCVAHYAVEIVLFWLDASQFADLEADDSVLHDYAAVR